MALTLNFQTSLRRLNVMTVRNVFANESIGKMISLVRNTFYITSCKELGAHFKYFQV